MDEEKKRLKRLFAGEAVPSMMRRSDEHDYSSKCFYMVTMTTEGRRPLLGRLEGRSDAPVGSADAPYIELSPLGMEVAKAWAAVSTYHPQVVPIAQQVMPDHFHGILYFRERVEGLHLGHVIRGFKTATNRAYRQLVLGEASQYAATMSQPTGKAEPPTMKGVATTGGGRVGLLWSKGYNDRILHNYHSLDRWKNYLQDNPRRLLVKRERPAWLRVQRNVEYAGLSFSAIGNQFLLDCPQKIQVQCSRSITEDEIERRRQEALMVGGTGVVFVSPSISKGEKAIMHAVFEAGFPVIYLQENGFTDLAKPGGKRFDACARGQMLILAPWEHHNNRLTIRRDQCLSLNEMARRICEEQVPTTRRCGQSPK